MLLISNALLVLASAFGYPREARYWAAEALRLSENDWSPDVLALAGDFTRAEAIANELARRRPKDVRLNERDLPVVRAAISISRGDGKAAVDAPQPTHRYAKTSVTPTYYRGLAYLQLGQGKDAESEFQQIVDRTGVSPLALEHSMAHLGLARAYSLQGETVKAKAAYQDFLTLWKDADPDIPFSSLPRRNTPSFIKPRCGLGKVARGVRQVAKSSGAVS
jgi:tetratricopeptide (TPR) repeat protein